MAHVETPPNTQQIIGVRFGRPEKTSVSVVVTSLSGSDVTVVIAGQVITIPMVALGTDATTAITEAGFAGNAMIGGLSPKTKYSYKVYQDSNIVSKDENGRGFYTWTAPGNDDDFILMPTTCDNEGSIGGTPGGTFYTSLRALSEANPDKPVYITHVDDHYGYMDFGDLNEGTFGAQHVITSYGNGARETGNEYDYALNGFAAFGLYHPDGVYGTTWGQDADRIWCMRNIPVLPQWGDHDAGNNEMGWDFDPTDNTTNGTGGTNGIANSGADSPAPKVKYDNAKAVWDALLKPLQGAALNTNDNSWQHTIGCVKLIAPDGISQGSGDATINTGDINTEFNPPTQIYGAAQCDDLITACDDANAYFKFALMNYGVRWTMDDANLPLDGSPTPRGEGRNGRGCQNPIAGNESYTVPRPAHVDYKRWITDENGIMGKDSCNGVSGTFGMLFGDYHCGAVQYHANITGYNTESYTCISLGTATGSTNFPSPGEEGNTHDGTTVEMESGAYRFDNIPIGGTSNQWWFVAMFVYGSRAKKEIEVEFREAGTTMLWNHKFVEGLGSRGRPMIDEVGTSLLTEDGFAITTESGNRITLG